MHNHFDGLARLELVRSRRGAERKPRDMVNSRDLVMTVYSY